MHSPIDFVLYTHLYKNGFAEFLKRLDALRPLLAGGGYQGQLVVLYDNECFKFIDDELSGKSSTVSEGDVRRREIERRCAGTVLEGRVRLFVASDLRDLLAELKSPGFLARSTWTCDDWRRFLCARSPASSYDKPKLVEAIVRRKYLDRSKEEGRPLPVFRIDQDVLVNSAGVSLVVNAIGSALGQVGPLLKSGNSFLVSGEYELSAESPDKVEFWLNSFATRLFPALHASTALDITATLSATERDDLMRQAFDPIVSRDFYGLDADLASSKPARGISALGAPPFDVPISGALETFSSDVQERLPPFCGLPYNVMWIDDFLKGVLVRELSRGPAGAVGGGHAIAPTFRLRNCVLVKQRPPVPEVSASTLDTYLPAVVRGIIWDAWLQSDIRTKSARWSSAPVSPFVKSLGSVLASGPLSASAETALANELRAAAKVRLAELDATWSALLFHGRKPEDSLAAFWVHTRLRSSPTPLGAGGSLSSDWATQLDGMIDDAIFYLRSVARWPDFLDLAAAYVTL